MTGLFPVPLMWISGLLPESLRAAAVADMSSQTTQTNFKSDRLRHTEIVDPRGGEGPYGELCDLIQPYLKQFGNALFGEDLNWQIKELWTNVLDPGGYQPVHAHSNSFISGIVYLTECDPSACTVFHRSLGGHDFVFSNDNPRAEVGPYSGSKWVAPPPEPGDMVLYPSYLLHEVPENQGTQRMTIAFNAIPDRLDSWGYAVHFSSERTSQ